MSLYRLSPPIKRLAQMCNALWVKHYAYRSEEFYVQWIRHYILFCNKRHPKEMAEPERVVPPNAACSVVLVHTPFKSRCNRLGTDGKVLITIAEVLVLLGGSDHLPIPQQFHGC